MIDSNKENELKINIDPIEEVKTKARAELSPMDTSFLKMNSQKVKSYQDLAICVNKQLRKNKEDLKALVKLKNDNHFAIENILIIIEQTKLKITEIEDVTWQLEHDSVLDEQKLDDLKVKEIKLNKDLTEQQNYKLRLESEYNDLLDSIINKKKCITQLQDELESINGLSQKLEKQIVIENNNYKLLQEDYEQNAVIFNNASLKNKSLANEHKKIVDKIKILKSKNDKVVQSIKLTADNNKITHQNLIELKEQYNHLSQRSKSNQLKLTQKIELKKQLLAKQSDAQLVVKNLKKNICDYALKVDAIGTNINKLEKNLKQIKKEEGQALMQLSRQNKQITDLKEKKDVISKVIKDSNSLNQTEIKQISCDKNDVQNINKLALAINYKIPSSKNAALILSALTELITIISENEFEDLKWISKVDSNKKIDACRIRFSNMKTQYSEMKKMLKPVIDKLSKRFMTYGFNIVTKSKTSPGEVLEAIEFRMTIDKTKTVALQPQIR